MADGLAWSPNMNGRVLPLAIAGLMFAASPVAAMSDQNEEVGVAIYFQAADGTVTSHVFEDPDGKLLRWSCEARLSYLTKKVYRTVAHDPALKAQLKDKKAIRSECVKLK
jgi:hypothetical protein